MDVTRLIFFLVLFAFILVLEWRRMRARSERDPDWAREMKGTPWRDRRRIALAVREGKRLDNPREARLAVGVAAEQRSFNRWLLGMRKARLALGGGLALLGLLAGAITVVILGAFILLIGLFETGHANRLSRRLERAERLNREQGRIGEEGSGHYAAGREP